MPSPVPENRDMSFVTCELCPKLCRIAPGQSGECRIRVNLDGTLRAVTFGRPCSIHVDPMEKKPLFHFLPGTPILSLATVGCNLHCRNCQNWEISQANPEETPAYVYPPERIVDLAGRERCRSVAYTYTDPVVYYEYALETSERAREAGLSNVLVTAGYANPAPWRRLAKVTDAANVDLKFFSDRRYREMTGATLAPVLAALEIAREEGVWLEVTNLVIPTISDDRAMIRSMCRWIRERLGADTPLHFSRFYPRYRLRNLPATPTGTLEDARTIAREEGLRYVYLGNVLTDDGEVTFCPVCGAKVIERVGYRVRPPRMDGGKCRACGAEIAGVWK
jgi:pyruvate formate lyase activating enzyme